MRMGIRMRMDRRNKYDESNFRTYFHPNKTKPNKTKEFNYFILARRMWCSSRLQYEKEKLISLHRMPSYRVASYRHQHFLLIDLNGVIKKKIHYEKPFFFSSVAMHRMIFYFPFSISQASFGILIHHFIPLTLFSNERRKT